MCDSDGLRALVSALKLKVLLVLNFTALSASHSCHCSSPLSVGFAFSPFYTCPFKQLSH